MSVTHADIDAAPDFVAVAKLATHIQREALDFSIAISLSKDEDRFRWFFEQHMKVRLGPAIITSSTDQKVIDDITRDCIETTAKFWPAMKIEMDKLL